MHATAVAASDHSVVRDEDEQEDVPEELDRGDFVEPEAFPVAHRTPSRRGTRNP